MRVFACVYLLVCVCLCVCVSVVYSLASYLNAAPISYMSQVFNASFSLVAVELAPAGVIRGVWPATPNNAKALGLDMLGPGMDRLVSMGWSCKNDHLQQHRHSYDTQVF